MMKRIRIYVTLALIISAAHLSAKEAVREMDKQAAEKSAVIAKEKEQALFFGVEVAPASPALIEQLGLSSGVGLVVRYVVPESPADKAGVKQHDVLVRFDDQILITQRQLSVLIRNHKPESEVLFTLMRKGKTTKIKSLLERREVPSHPGGYFKWMGKDHFSRPAVDFGVHQGHFMGEALFGGEIDHIAGGPVFKSSGTIKGIHPQMSFPHGGNVSTGVVPQFLFSDEAGSVDVMDNGGVKVFTIRDVDGNETFNGSVLDEEIEKLAPEIRARLKKMEHIELPNIAIEGVELVPSEVFRITI